MCGEFITLGCFWPVLWAKPRTYVYMGDDSDTEEHDPWGRFGGFSWEENLSRAEALDRFKMAVNLLHLGDFPKEMAGKLPESFLHGSVGSVACPAHGHKSCGHVHGLWP